VKALVEVGNALVELASYIANAAVALARKIAQAALRFGAALADLVSKIAAWGFNAIKRIVEAAFDLGRKLLDVIREGLRLAGNLLRDIVKAAVQLGKTIVEFVGSVIAFTYRTAARLIDAMIEAGLKVADMLAQALAKSYFVFRKMVNGVLKALGPVGDVLDWVLTQAASAVDRLYREAVLAIRYVKKSVDEILEWAAAKTRAVFEGIVKAIEGRGRAHRGVPVGRLLRRRRARAAGEVTQRLKNSISYCPHVDGDGCDRRDPGRRQGPAQGRSRGRRPDRLGRHRTVQIVKEVTAELLAAGTTVAQLVSDTIRHPQHALDNLTKALRELGKTWATSSSPPSSSPRAICKKKVIQSLKDIGEGCSTCSRAWQKPRGSDRRRARGDPRGLRRLPQAPRRGEDRREDRLQDECPAGRRPDLRGLVRLGDERLVPRRGRGGDDDADHPSARQLRHDDEGQPAHADPRARPRVAGREHRSVLHGARALLAGDDGKRCVQLRRRVGPEGEYDRRWQARPLQPGAAGADHGRLLPAGEGRKLDDGLRPLHREVQAA
jgi:hypothetical protein